MSVMDAPEALCDIGPFAGLTDEKARVINGALVGRRVYVEGGRFERSEREFVFGGVALRDAGFGGWSGPRAVGDLQLWTWRDGYGSPGSTWVLSPSLVRVFEVLPYPELSPCRRCGAWVRQDELRDDAWYGPEYGSDLVCRSCWTNDGGSDLWWTR